MKIERTLIVPVSGGKDSQVVLSLALAARRADVVAVHQGTSFDHPLTYQQMQDMERFYGVPIARTDSKYGGMFGLLDHIKYFPNSAARGCTQRLKQEPFAAWLEAQGYNADNAEIWFGMRSDESADRQDRYGDLSAEDSFALADVAAFYGATKLRASTIGRIPVRLPIVDWNTERVFAYIAAEGAPLNALYERGHHRVGCYPCLLARKAEWKAAAADPTGREHLAKMLELQDRWQSEGNPRKFIKVHRVWDVRAMMAGAEVQDLPADQCGYCSI